MSIKITSDSTCDLSPELIKRYSVEIFPLYIHMDGNDYRDGVDIHTDDIFRNVEAGGDICATSAINVGDYIDYFSKLSPRYDAVIHINISSEFSGCHQNACIAAQEFTNVYVVDSRNLSTGHGHVVIQAALLAEQGLPPEEICSRLADIAGRVDASFILDRLDYMRKGGRCSSVVALGANLLKLKPSIHVIDGKMQVGKKYRGAFDKCMCEYIRDKLQGRSDIITDRIFITYSSLSDDNVELAVKTVKECMRFDEIYTTNAGCTVAGHCGPNTVGVLFIRKPE